MLLKGGVLHVENILELQNLWMVTLTEIFLFLISFTIVSTYKII